MRWLALLALLSCAPSSSRSSAVVHDDADLVLVHGTIMTMDPGRPRAQAIAVKGQRIVHVGEDARAFVGPRTRVVELGGRTVVPALTDAHAHLVGLGHSLAQIDLEGCASAEACAERIRGAAPAGEGAWIRGRGWDQSRFSDRQFPGRAPLDRAAPDRPVWLRRVDGHAGWANTRALALAGIDRNTADPDGGRVLRDGAGEPTGVLVDNAMSLVERVIPRPGEPAIEAAILRAQAVALEQGLTEVHEMGIDGDAIGTYRRLAREGKLRIRVYAFRSGSELDAALASRPDRSVPDAFFTLRGIKLYADGALGSRGAALLAPYADDAANSGLLLTPPETIARAAAVALRSGWQLAIHAIGDRANRIVLDAYEHAGCTPARDHRFRVEHAQVLATDDIPRLRGLGVIASMQPKHATSDMRWAELRLGQDRLAGAYAWRRVLASGARVAWGSDFPVERPSVVEGLHAAVTRTDPGGDPPGGWRADQRVTLDEALHGFSAGAAFAAFEEAWRGRAAPGQAADLTVMDRELAPGNLAGARAVMTIVAGRVMFER